MARPIEELLREAVAYVEENKDREARRLASDIRLALAPPCAGFHNDEGDHCTGEGSTRRWGGVLMHLCGACADRFDHWVEERGEAREKVGAA